MLGWKSTSPEIFLTTGFSETELTKRDSDSGKPAFYHFSFFIFPLISVNDFL
tara:strand:- start:356 stop:511 length:156 start_codon:yes stop_codon:yes gene_type:complete